MSEKLIKKLENYIKTFRSYSNSDKSLSLDYLEIKQILELCQKEK